MPSLEFDESPSHLSRFKFSDAPASTASKSKPKPAIVEIGSSSAAKSKPKIQEVSDGASSSRAPSTKPKIAEIEDDDDVAPPSATKTRINIVEVSEDGAFDITDEEPPPLDDAPPLDDEPPPLADPTPKPPPPPQEDEGPSLMEQMMADANVARDKKLTEKKNEQQRMKKQFGDGLKSNLKKGFLSGGSKKKPTQKSPKESAPEVIQTIRPQSRGKAKPGERESALKQEVADAMAASENSTVQALKGGEWITPDLTQKIASNEKLTRAMADPRFDAALKMMSKDPKRAMALLESEPWLREAFVELSGLMGGHFSALGEQQQQAAAGATPTPEAVPEAEMGPMAQDALKRHRAGELPKPATADEQKQVEAVLQDDEIKGILMDPAMQNLMRACSDPSALQKAMRDPQIRAKFEKLAAAGLIRIER